MPDNSIKKPTKPKNELNEKLKKKNKKKTFVYTLVTPKHDMILIFTGSQFNIYQPKIQFPISQAADVLA